MEIIRKTICLEKSKSRVNSGLPYIQCNGDGNILTCDTTTIVDREHDIELERLYHNSNYGNFQCDIDETNPLFWCVWSATTTLINEIDVDDDVKYYIRTTNLFKRYNELLDVLRTSLHLKHVKNEGCENTSVYTDTYLSEFEYDKTTYDFLREAEVVPMYDENGYENFVDLGNGVYNGNYENNADYVIVVGEYDTFIDNGGNALIYLVDKLLVDPDSGTSVSTIDGFVAPYVSIPLLLTHSEDSLGVMTPYIDEENDFLFSGEVSYDVANEFNPNISGASIYEGVDSAVSEYWKLHPLDINDLSAITDVVVESKLQTLRTSKYFTSDNNEILPGLFVEFENPFFTSCHKTGNEWTGTSTDGTILKCADGEDLSASGGYHTLMLFSSLNKYEGDVSSYKFLIKYDNSETSPMLIPYVVGEIVNKGFSEYDKVYTGDYIINIEENDNEITFEYVIGASFETTYNESAGTYDCDFQVIPNTGVYYKETYPYHKSVSATTKIDGVDTIYWYNDIDFNSQSKVVYSKDLNLNRSVNTTKVDSMQMGDVWRTDGSVLNTPLIKEEYLMSASMDAVTDIDITIDRGNATAFERHLMLGECNTFQDLINIRNNFYNL